MSPVPLNPLGIKGAREAAAIPVGPMIASAVEQTLGLPVTKMPLKLYQLT
jgi:CO/xanthine dehydrogenase Mo-binding subunit